MDLSVDLYTAWTISFWSNVVLLALLMFIWWRAGNYASAAIVAWWRKTGIAQEWMKTGKYKYYAAPIPKEFPEIIEKPNDAGVIEIKRRHNGYDLNGNQIFQFSTEHGITYNTETITGERYFSPESNNDYGFFIFNKEKNEWEKIDKPTETSKFFVKYPTHTVSPTEFVQYQKSNLNPTVIAGALKYREMAVKRALQNPFGAFLAQNGAWLIGFLVVAWMIMTWMNNNNSAKDYEGKFMECQQQLWQNGVTTTLPPAITPQQVPSGAAIVTETTNAPH